MIVAILGLVDIVAGIILAAGGLGVFHMNPLAWSVAIALIVKGAWSWIHNLATTGSGGTKLDFMGIIDIVSGVMIVSSVYGFFMFFFLYFGVILMIKGVYSFFCGVTRT
jgi:hypothetical protein